MFCFGPMSFEVKAWIFVQLIVFQTPLSIFVSWCLNKKELALMLIGFREIFNCKVSLKPRCSMCLLIVERNFAHSFDQVANFQKSTLEKITIKVTKVVLIQVFFLTVGSKHKKMKMKTRNTMAPSHHSKASSSQKRESHFSLAWVMEFSICLLKKYSCLQHLPKSGYP